MNILNKAWAERNDVLPGINPPTYRPIETLSGLTFEEGSGAPLHGSKDSLDQPIHSSGSWLNVVEWDKSQKIEPWTLNSLSAYLGVDVTQLYSDHYWRLKPRWNAEWAVLRMKIINACCVAVNTYENAASVVVGIKGTGEWATSTSGAFSSAVINAAPGGVGTFVSYSFIVETSNPKEDRQEYKCEITYAGERVIYAPLSGCKVYVNVTTDSGLSHVDEFDPLGTNLKLGINAMGSLARETGKYKDSVRSIKWGGPRPNGPNPVSIGKDQGFCIHNFIFDYRVSDGFTFI